MSALNESKTPLCRELLADFVFTLFLGTACILGKGKKNLEKLHLEQGKAKHYHLLA